MTEPTLIEALQHQVANLLNEQAHEENVRKGLQILAEQEKARADKAEAAVAEMRDALELARHRFIRTHAKNLDQLESMATPYDKAPSTSCGLGYLAPDKAQRLRDELIKCRDFFETRNKAIWESVKRALEETP